MSEFCRANSGASSGKLTVGKVGGKLPDEGGNVTHEHEYQKAIRELTEKGVKIEIITPQNQTYSVDGGELGDFIVKPADLVLLRRSGKLTLEGIKELSDQSVKAPELKTHEWIRFASGSSGTGVWGYVLKKYSDTHLEVGYYQNDLKAIGEEVIWTGKKWDFRYEGPCGRYLHGREEAIVKSGPWGGLSCPPS